MAEFKEVVTAVGAELKRARETYPSFNSPHEGYGILLEEMDELWDFIKVKQSKHNKAAMRKEAIQVAAMAMRFVMDLCP